MKSKEEWKKIGNKFKTTSSKTAILFPAIDKIIEKPDWKKILDVGCGDGYAVRWYTEKGAKVIGVDISKDSIKACKESDPKGSYFVGDVTDLKINGEFDWILSLLVLISIDNKKDLLNAIKNMKLKLAKDGRMIIALAHPAFDMINENMETMTRNSIGEYSYSKKGLSISYKHKTKDISFTDYHWMLEDYAECIKKAGLVIEDIQEPLPVPESEEINPALYSARVRFPAYLILVVRKA